jgi:hypothetical protein
MSGAAEAADAPLRLKIGYTVVAAAARDQVMAAIVAENAHFAIAGLPDELNTALIDPAKAEALLAALQAGGALAPLAGRALSLNGTSLGIATGSPTVASRIVAPIVLTIVSEHGDSVLARANVTVDCGLARRRADEAHERSTEVERTVRSLEGRARTDDAARDALEVARRLRATVTQSWNVNAEALVACAPGASATAERDAARAAARGAVQRGGRMGP